MTNYARGAVFERTVKADLEAKDYFAMRSAGSHGIVDIVAINKGGEPWMVQCKIDGRMDRQDRAELSRKAELYCFIPIMASRLKGGKIRYRRLLPNDEWDEIKP